MDTEEGHTGSNQTMLALWLVLIAIAVTAAVALWALRV